MKKNATIKVRVDKLPPLAKHLLETKTLMQEHTKGKVTQNELDKKGIKFVNPL